MINRIKWWIRKKLFWGAVDLRLIRTIQFEVPGDFDTIDNAAKISGKISNFWNRVYIIVGMKGYMLQNECIQLPDCVKIEGGSGNGV